MRAFIKPIGIERLSLEARIIYSFFCVFSLLGMMSASGMYITAGLLGDGGVEAHYLGRAVAVDETTDGPVLDLPDEAAAPMVVGKSERQIMETFHFHVFIMPLALMVLAHLFIMCPMRMRWRVTIILVSFGSTLIHLLTPPLIYFSAGGFTWLLFPSALIMAVSWVLMTVWSLVEMWRRWPDEGLA